MKRPLGRILMDSGFLSSRDLNLSLLEQTQTNELLGQVLVQMGVLDSAEVVVHRRNNRDRAILSR
jgi:hypothetical protein